MEINFASGNIRFVFATATATGQCLLGPVPTLLEFQATTVPRQELKATTVPRHTVTHPTHKPAAHQPQTHTNSAQLIPASLLLPPCQQQS